MENYEGGGFIHHFNGNENVYFIHVPLFDEEYVFSFEKTKIFTITFQYGDIQDAIFQAIAQDRERNPDRREEDPRVLGRALFIREPTAEKSPIMIKGNHVYLVELGYRR